jgi:hypothetical protein
MMEKMEYGKENVFDLFGEATWTNAWVVHTAAVYIQVTDCPLSWVGKGGLGRR